MIHPLTPAVYKLEYDRNDGYQLIYDKPRFIIIGKNYGEIDKHVDIFWTRYLTQQTSLGVMLTGCPGSGKSRVAEILGNFGIDANMAVLLVTDVEINLTIIPFLDNLHNMVIIFDEFSKNFDSTIQDKMLTMLASVSNFKKLFIITENDRNTISPYIRTRPGRIRYSVDYDRIKESVILEYCSEHDVDHDFLDDILEIYNGAIKFTYDHLQTIVTEREFNPTMSIDDLLEILNLDELIKIDLWSITKIVNLVTKKEQFLASGVLEQYTKEKLTSKYFTLWVEYTELDKSDKPDLGSIKTIKIIPSSLNRIEHDNTYVYVVGDMEVTFSLTDSK